MMTFNPIARLATAGLIVAAACSSAQAQAPQGGMRGAVDPTTGRIVTPSDTQPVSPAERDSFSTSDSGLQEVPITTGAGGYKVDLDGRFQSPLVATTDANGNITVHHANEPPHAR